MTRWLKVNADAVHHPKAAKAGPWGWCVREACWHIAKSMDCPGGDVTAYWRAGFIRDWSPVLRLHRKGLSYTLEGMSTAVAAGWIDHADGRYVVHDWDHYQTETTTARKRRERVGTGGNDVRTDRERGANGSERSSNEVRTSSERAVNEVRTEQPHLMISKELQIDRLQGDGDGDGDLLRESSARKKPRASLAGDHDVQAAKHWLATHPWHVARPTEHGRLLPQYAEQMGQLRRLDRRSSEDIRKLTDAIAKDIGDPGGTWRGWAANCIAPRKLRLEDRQGRRYWDVLWEQLIARPRTSASRGHIGVYRSSEHVHDGSGDIWSGDDEETA